MKLSVIAATSVALVGIAALPSAANAAAQSTQTTFVDSRIGTATTSFPLPAGRYSVRVVGTYSPYAASLYNQAPGSYFATCGTPENAPRFPSPSPAANGAVGADAAFLFAAPHKPFKCGNFLPPYKQTKFVIAKGSGPFESIAPQGNPSAPSDTHAYRYRVTVATEQKLTFKIVDSSYTDNYGRLRTVITPLD